MKRNTLYSATSIATASNNASSLHSATILKHYRMFPCILLSVPEMTSQANSTHSPLFLGRERGKRVIIQTLKIHTKLTKIATTIIFSHW